MKQAITPDLFRAPQGTHAFFGEDEQYLRFVEKVCRHRFRQAGFHRIIVPAYEDLELYEKAFGEDNALLQNDTYTFSDKQQMPYALRPEMTLGVIRTFLEHKMDTLALPAEYYYIDRIYRAQRVKMGYKREFWQAGGEVIGESDPAIDAQIIYLCYRILCDLGLQNCIQLHITTIGNKQDLDKYYAALGAYYTPLKDKLTLTTQELLTQKRYLQVIEARSEDEEIYLSNAPKIHNYLSKTSIEYYEEVLRYIDLFDIPYIKVDHISRKSEYDTHTIFAFYDTHFDEKIASGARYDGLIERLGGPKNMGGMGFQMGIERIITLMKEEKKTVPKIEYLQIYVSATGIRARKEALPLLIKLREYGFHAVGVMGKTGMVEQLNRAQKFNVPYTLLMGDKEADDKVIMVRDMKKGTTETIPMDTLLEYLSERLPTDSIEYFLGHK